MVKYVENRGECGKREKVDSNAQIGIKIQRIQNKEGRRPCQKKKELVDLIKQKNEGK